MVMGSGYKTFGQALSDRDVCQVFEHVSEMFCGRVLKEKKASLKLLNNCEVVFKLLTSWKSQILTSWLFKYLHCQRMIQLPGQAECQMKSRRRQLLSIRGWKTLPPSA